MEEISLSKIIWTTLKIIVFLFSTWILVHIFSLIGVFIAVGFFIWWLFFPKYTICLSCRLKKLGQYCKFCKTTVDQTTGRHPKNIISVFWNVSIMLFASLLSLIVVYIEYNVLTAFIHPKSPKTVSFVIPSESQYRVGEVFPLKIQLNGIEVPINAIQADIGFDKERLEVVEISTKDSFATVFLQKEMNNDLGYARLSGGLPSPGFNAPEGLFGTVYFKCKKAGLAQVFFLDTSLVLANDGNGTNVIKEFSSVSYLITPEALPLDEQELQNTLILENVLGAEDEINENQILLFDSEQDSNVLGVEESVQSKDKTEDKGFLIWMLEILTKIDLFIMERVEWVLSLFKIDL